MEDHWIVMSNEHVHSAYLLLETSIFHLARFLWIICIQNYLCKELSSTLVVLSMLSCHEKYKFYKQVPVRGLQNSLWMVAEMMEKY